MIITVTDYDFLNAFQGTQYENQFSCQALMELLPYYEELERDTGEQIELDVTAIACEWCEYADLAEANDDFGVADIDDHITNEDERYISACDNPHRDENDPDYDPDEEVENPDFEPEYDYDDYFEDIRNSLQNSTTIIEFEGGVLVQQF